MTDGGEEMYARRRHGIRLRDRNRQFPLPRWGRVGLASPSIYIYRQIEGCGHTFVRAPGHTLHDRFPSQHLRVRDGAQLGQERVRAGVGVHAQLVQEPFGRGGAGGFVGLGAVGGHFWGLRGVKGES